MGLRGQQIIHLDNFRHKGGARSEAVAAPTNFPSSPPAPTKKINPHGVLQPILRLLTAPLKTLSMEFLDSAVESLLPTFGGPQPLFDWLTEQGSFFLDLELLTEARSYFILAHHILERERQPVAQSNPFLQILGDIALKLGHHNEASHCYKKILATEPRHAESCHKLAALCRAMNLELAAAKWERRAGRH